MRSFVRSCKMYHNVVTTLLTPLHLPFVGQDAAILGRRLSDSMSPLNPNARPKKVHPHWNHPHHRCLLIWILYVSSVMMWLWLSFRGLLWRRLPLFEILKPFFSGCGSSTSRTLPSYSASSTPLEKHNHHLHRHDFDQRLSCTCCLLRCLSLKLSRWHGSHAFGRCTTNFPT